MTITAQPLTEEQRKGLPAFVQAYLMELIQDRCQFEEDDETRKEQEQDLLEKTDYDEITGTIDRPYKDVSKLVNFWIASHDNVKLHIHIGGSACWITPNSHYIFFEAIDPQLLDRHPSRNTWWVINEDSLTIYQIAVRPEEEVAADFPDVD